MSTRPGRSGVSLPEVLIVIGILALLLALLLPTLFVARRASRRAACLSNLHQIGVALNGYANDNRGQLPARYTRNSSATGDLEPYAGGFDSQVVANEGGLALLFRWPDGTPAYDAPASVPYLSTATVFRCPGQAARDDWPLLATGLPNDPDNTRVLAGRHGNNLGWSSYGYGYVPPPATAPDAMTLSLVGYERYTLRAREPARRAILWDACLSLPTDELPGGRWHDFHDGHDGGHVMYLDTHAVWRDGRAIHQALAGLRLFSDIAPAFLRLADADR